MLKSLFASQERIKILNHVLYKETSTVTTTAHELNLSKGLVSQFLKHLEKINLLEYNKGYHPTNHLLTRTIKILLNSTKVDFNSIKKKSFIKGIGIYGSWAHGTNTEYSDLDLWIKVDSYPDEKDLADLQKTLREMTDTEVQLLVLSPQKIDQIKKDRPFFESLYHGSLLIWGEPL